MKNIVADAHSRLTLNGNQENTQNSTLLKKEIMSEINDIGELPEGILPINIKLIQKHQRMESSIKYKYKDGTYHKGYFRGVSNIHLSLITCKDTIFITSKLQCYVLHW